MKSLPIRDGQFDLPNFAAWLARNGAEIGIPGNPYEVIRYRAYVDGGRSPATHIVYRKETGLLTWTGETKAHYQQFLTGSVLWPSAPRDPDRPFLTTYPTEKAKRRLRGEVTREKLFERDGDECWFCGEPMGDDCTIEHLVPKSAGGRNMLANYALAHSGCNHRAANLPLVKKIAMRARLRGVTA
jgi:5-methylcytosine-specific restriction endonuclease McrA